MVATASTGYWPDADSADSITASAPSKMAVATSETSARVGTGLVIIDSSICVATTTGLPARRQARVISFCTPGTFSSGISTPRSPRATISASARSRMSSSRVTACGFSILAITAARPRVIFFASAMSSGRWMNDSATQSMPASSAASRSARSFGASAASGTTVSRQAHALAVRQSCRRPRRARRCAAGSSRSTTRRSLPSSIRSVSPALMAAKISGCGRWTRVASPGVGSVVEDEILAVVDLGPVVLEAAEPQLRSLQIDQDADRPVVLGLDGADRAHELAHLVVLV